MRIFLLLSLLLCPCIGAEFTADISKARLQDTPVFSSKVDLTPPFSAQEQIERATALRAGSEVVDALKMRVAVSSETVTLATLFKRRLTEESGWMDMQLRTRQAAQSSPKLVWLHLPSDIEALSDQILRKERALGELMVSGQLTQNIPSLAMPSTQAMQGAKLERVWSGRIVTKEGLSDPELVNAFAWTSFTNPTFGDKRLYQGYWWTKGTPLKIEGVVRANSQMREGHLRALIQGLPPSKERRGILVLLESRTRPFIWKSEFDREFNYASLVPTYWEGVKGVRLTPFVINQLARKGQNGNFYELIAKAEKKSYAEFSLTPTFFVLQRLFQHSLASEADFDLLQNDPSEFVARHLAKVFLYDKLQEHPFEPLKVCEYSFLLYSF